MNFGLSVVDKWCSTSCTGDEVATGQREGAMFIFHLQDFNLAMAKMGDNKRCVLLPLNRTFGAHRTIKSRALIRLLLSQKSIWVLCE